MTKLIVTLRNFAKVPENGVFYGFQGGKENPELSDKDERPLRTQPRLSFWIQVAQLRTYTL